MIASPRAMILAAGLGTRLRPLTEHLPKPLVPVAGRPLLENVIINLRAAGVREIAINTHHLPERIEAFVAGFEGGGIELFHEPQILGTGGGLVNARGFLAEADCFLLHNGDVLTDMSLEALVEEHLRSGAAATLALVDFAPLNKVLAAPDGTVTDIVGRRGAPASEGSRLLTYSGVAAFSPELFDHLPPDGPSSLIDGLLSLMAARPGSVRAYAPSGVYWNDLGTLRRYRGAHEDVLVKRSVSLRGIDIPKGSIHAARGASVSPEARLSGFVSVGPGCRVEAGAELANCVLLGGAVVGAGQSRRSVVIGPDFRIGFESPSAARRCIVGKRGFGPGLQAHPLVEQGSDRQFFRISEGGRSEVLVLCAEDDPDFERYVAIGRYLHERDLGAPAILDVDPEDRTVVLEDLGDKILYLSVREEKDPRVLESLYAGVIDLLVGLQTTGTRDLFDCPAAGERALDHGQLRWESSYFRENFLERHLGFAPARTRELDGEFERLARLVESQPQVFIHRDFQSQNILLKSGRARIVDFQGARRGPVAYDLASLLRDPYVRLPVAVRAALASRYREALASSGGPRLGEEELRAFLTAAGLQRNMQALGAYCFLSLVKGKTQFKRFVEPGLAELEGGLSALRGSPDELPLLSAITAEARSRLS